MCPMWNGVDPTTGRPMLDLNGRPMVDPCIHQRLQGQPVYAFYRNGEFVASVRAPAEVVVNQNHAMNQRGTADYNIGHNDSAYYVACAHLLTGDVTCVEKQL